MTLRRKLLIGFGGLLLIVLAGSALSIIVLTRYSHTLERVFRENYDSVVYCEQMKSALDALSGHAQRLLWQEPEMATLDPAAAISNFERNLQLERGNCSLPGEAEQTRRLASIWAQFAATHSRIMSSTGLQRRLLYEKELLPEYQLARHAADVIATMNLSNMVSVDGRVKHTLNSVRRALVILAVAATVLAGTLVAVMGATVLRPLQILTRSARQIGSGNLDLRINLRSHDEIGQLAEAFNTMAARLGELRRVDHQRLLRIQQTTQLAIDSLRDAVFVIGPSGHVEIANQTARMHFGILPGREARGLGLAWLSDLYAQVLATRRAVDPQGYQSAIQLFDSGEERFLLPRGVPMLDTGGAMLGVTVILIDVTRLRRADELKSGLISTVSHELRTPLTGMRMAIMMLAQDRFGSLSATQSKLLSAAQVESDRLYRTIENLLSISRIESGGQSFQFRSMAAGEIVSQAVDPLRPAFDEKRIQLTIQVAERLPSVLADPSCIGLALSNLISNALKYTPAGGKVLVTAAQDAATLAFSVTDSGPGVPEQFAGRIFERFFRVPSAAGPTGAGLGLAIAKEIVEAHGGTIGFRNGDGTTFIFTLPHESSPTSQPPLDHDQPPAAAPLVMGASGN